MTFDAWVAGALMLFTTLVGLGCADFSRGGPAPTDEGAGGSGAGGAGSGSALSFAADVESILSGGCRGCHTAGGQAEGTTLLLTGMPEVDYAVVVPLIDTSAAAASRLLLKMTGNGHGGGRVYAVGTPSYQTVLLWIQQGAMK